MNLPISANQTDLSILILGHMRSPRQIDVVCVEGERAGQNGLEVEDVGEVGDQTGNASAKYMSIVL